MIAYNDSFSEYLDMLIREEEAKEEVIRDDKKIEQMKKDKRTYETKKDVIVDTITSGSKDKNDVIPIEKIYEMRQKLCSLKHNGKTLKEALGKCIWKLPLRFSPKSPRKTSFCKFFTYLLPS